MAPIKKTYAAAGSMEFDRRPPLSPVWNGAEESNHSWLLSDWFGKFLEKAARGGWTFDKSTTDFHHPDWIDDHVPHMNIGGAFPANGYGLHDMARKLND
jgi:hypothetical protein